MHPNHHNESPADKLCHAVSYLVAGLALCLIGYSAKSAEEIGPRQAGGAMVLGMFIAFWGLKEFKNAIWQQPQQAPAPAAQPPPVILATPHLDTPFRRHVHRAAPRHRAPRQP